MDKLKEFLQEIENLQEMPHEFLEKINQQQIKKKLTRKEQMM